MKQMKYGFSFRGSKSKIAEDIIKILPSAENFYDLFAGGGAITHCALLSGKWKNVYANDIQGTMKLFLDAVNGKYRNEKRWISREQFNAEKDKDQYIRWIWSFGNNGKSYLYGEKNEKIKKEAHEFLFANGYDYTSEKRIELTKLFRKKIKKEGIFKLEYLERLQHLGQLERLQHLEKINQSLLQRLKISDKDYKDIEIKPNSVVYCDIPYSMKKVKTKEDYYGIKFDIKDFYKWAKKIKHPVYFSDCFCDDDYFIPVWEKESICLMNNKYSGNGKKKIIEKLYWNKI